MLRLSRYSEQGVRIYLLVPRQFFLQLFDVQVRPAETVFQYSSSLSGFAALIEIEGTV